MKPQYAWAIRICLFVGILLAFGVSARPALAQDRVWTWQNPPRNVVAVWGSSNSDIFAVGSPVSQYSRMGSILHYDGIRWSAMNPPAGTSFDLLAVWGSSSSDVFAVGYEGLITHYDGASWSRLSSGASADLNGVWGSSATDVFAVGTFGTILHYDGINWTSMNSGTTKNLRGIWGSSRSDVYAAADGGLILHYDGATWSSTDFGTGFSFISIWGSSSSDVFAVGAGGMMAHFDGATWEWMYSATTYHLTSVWGSSSDNVFAASQYGVVVHFDGTAWTQMSIGVGAPLEGIWVSNDGNAYAVGSNVIAHYDGSSWRTMSGGVHTSLHGVWGSSSNDVFAVGDYGAILHYNGRFWTTSLPSYSYTADTLSSIWGTSSTDVFAVSYDGTILHYDGASWSVMSSQTGHSFYDIWGINSSDIYAVGDIVLHYDGVEWTQVNVDIGGGALGIWGTGTNNLYIVGSSGMILHYDKSGWNKVDSETTVLLRAVWGSSNDDVFVVGDDGIILHYDGTSWSRMESGVSTLLYPVYLYDVWGSSSNNVFVVIYSREFAPATGKILHYDGQSWKPMFEDESYALHGVWGTNASDVFAVGIGATILHYLGLPDNAITLTARTVGSGSVTVNPDRAWYPISQTVVLTATPSTGWLFAGWSGDATGTASPLTVTLSSSKQITATFTEVPSGDWVVSGSILDSVTNNPIPGVQVQLSNQFGSHELTYSDASGAYSFTVTAVGSYNVDVYKSMYTFAERVFPVTVPSNSQVPNFKGTLDNDFSPIVFVPGIMGSTLRANRNSDDLWPGQVWGTDHSILSNAPGVNHGIFSPDVIRQYVTDFYGPLLDALEYGNDSTFINPEYDVAGDPMRRTAAGCDLSQAKDDPTMFVFAYDWRLSNKESAARLKDYIACIHRFYPGAKVNIVAHSMGGLVARRYVLDTPNHFVRRLITIGTPWLGAPKFLHVLETGDLGLLRVLLWPQEVRRLLYTFPGSHELLPSATYFDYARRSHEPQVLLEAGADINGIDGNYQEYTYQDLIDLVNTRYRDVDPCTGKEDLNPVCRIGDNNQAFHINPGQDLWVDGPDDIEYHYIVGVQNSKATFAGYVAISLPTCGDDNICGNDYFLEAVNTRGDGTVPLVSARRAANSQQPDGNNIKIHPIAPSKAFGIFDDDGADHLGMTKNPKVHKLLIGILSGQPTVQIADVEQIASEATPAYYLNVFGTRMGYVTDADGQITGAISPTLVLNNAHGVTYYPSSTSNFQIVAPTIGVYTVTFQSGNEPLRIDLVLEGDNPPVYAVRWRDLSLPSMTTVQLRLTPAGVQDLRYDSDSDGVPDAPVEQQPVVAQGFAAADTEAPTVVISVASDRLVNIAATDSSGVMAIHYSFDGKRFQPYTVAVLSPPEATEVYAFADDNLANRSVLFVQTLPELPPQADVDLYLPYVSR